MTLILSVVEVPVEPAGNVQLYEVAFETGLAKYERLAPAHNESGPFIEVGAIGIVVTVTASVRGILGHCALLAVTETFPEVPAVAETAVVVDEPDHPEGKDQVYEAAPETEDIE